MAVIRISKGAVVDSIVNFKSILIMIDVSRQHNEFLATTGGSVPAVRRHMAKRPPASQAALGNHEDKGAAAPPPGYGLVSEV